MSYTSLRFTSPGTFRLRLGALLFGVLVALAGFSDSPLHSATSSATPSEAHALGQRQGQSSTRPRSNAFSGSQRGRRGSVAPRRRATGGAPARSEQATSAIRSRVERATSASGSRSAGGGPAPRVAEVGRRLSTASAGSTRSDRSAALTRVQGSRRGSASGAPSTASLARRASELARAPQRDAQTLDSARNRVRTGSANRDGYPPALGFQGTPSAAILSPGTRIDRYGFEGGRFASPLGTPFGARALPAAAQSKPYVKYEIVRPVATLQGSIRPWFGQPGNGTQYYFARPIRDLLASGDLRRVP